MAWISPGQPSICGYATHVCLYLLDKPGDLIIANKAATGYYSGPSLLRSPKGVISTGLIREVAFIENIALMHDSSITMYFF